VVRFHKAEYPFQLGFLLNNNTLRVDPDSVVSQMVEADPSLNTKWTMASQVLDVTTKNNLLTVKHNTVFESK